MEQYRIFLLPEAQADKEKLMLNLQGKWESRDASLYLKLQEHLLMSHIWL